MQVEKKLFSTFISKYYVSEFNNSVIYEIENGQLLVYFDSNPSKVVIGKVLSKSTNFSIESSISIMNSKLLRNAIDVLPGDSIDININQVNNQITFTSVIDNAKFVYYFGSRHLLNKPKRILEKDMHKLFSIDISRMNFNNIFKFSGAMMEKECTFLVKSSNFYIHTGSSDGGNHLSLNVGKVDTKSDFKLVYNVDKLQEIFFANKDCEVFNFTMYDKPECIKLIFDNDNFYSEYFLPTISQNKI